MFYLKALMMICCSLTIPLSTFASQTISRLSAETIDVLRQVAPYLPYDPIIIEAGACEGTDSKKLAKFWKKGQVHCFEPVPELFNLTYEKTKRRRNVHRYQKALSDYNGTATFYVASWDGVHTGHSSSLLAPKEHLTYSSVTFPHMIEVETITLDTWAQEMEIDHIDFLWLDMQGYELNMLKASEMAKKATVIFTEVEFVEAYTGQYLYNDVVSWMEENGFELFATDFDVENEANRPWYGNALFIKKNKI